MFECLDFLRNWQNPWITVVRLIHFNNDWGPTKNRVSGNESPSTGRSYYVWFNRWALAKFECIIWYRLPWHIAKLETIRFHCLPWKYSSIKSTLWAITWVKERNKWSRLLKRKNAQYRVSTSLETTDIAVFSASIQI